MLRVYILWVASEPNVGPQAVLQGLERNLAVSPFALKRHSEDLENALMPSAFTYVCSRVSKDFVQCRP